MHEKKNKTKQITIFLLAFDWKRQNMNQNGTKKLCSGFFLPKMIIIKWTKTCDETIYKKKNPKRELMKKKTEEEQKKSFG